MKTFTALLLIVFSSSAFSISTTHSRSLCSQMVNLEIGKVAAVKDRFDVGETTSTDVAIAELSLLDVSFECRQIYYNDYCNRAVMQMTLVVEGLKEEAGFGSRTTLEVEDAELKLSAIQNKCQ